MKRKNFDRLKEKLKNLEDSLNKPFVRKTKAQELRESSGNIRKTVAESIMGEAERLKDHVQSLVWYDAIPYEDRKILKKEGFTLVDGDSTVTITW